MFIIVCASTARSSVRVGCATAQAAQAKILELEEAGIGTVRAFDDSGNRLTREQLAAMADEDRTEAQPRSAEQAASMALIAETLCGADADVDSLTRSLHDITQLAAALRPGFVLTVRNSARLTPIEQASIASVMPGQVQFI